MGPCSALTRPVGNKLFYLPRREEVSRATTKFRAVGQKLLQWHTEIVWVATEVIAILRGKFAADQPLHKKCGVVSLALLAV